MPDRSVVLAEVVRSGFVEGCHRGALVVLDPDGSVALGRGDLRAPVFPRSCNKLMQAIGLVELGYHGRGELLALAAASHSGEPFHIDAVRRILASAGLDESALRTPPDRPLDDDAWLDLVRAGGGPEPVLMNCSGKHAAMIAVCAEQGFPLDDYRAADHPLQVRLRRTIEEQSGETAAAVGVDGCGAPVVAITLVGLARAFARAVSGRDGTPERLVADAMRAHPDYVGGTSRDVTLLMQGVPGLLLKDGAEGVLAGALPDGRAFAFKVDDGGERARPPVAVAVLRRLGIEAEVLDRFETQPLLGGGVPVGEVRAAPTLLG